jgi:hypothetical protein
MLLLEMTLVLNAGLGLWLIASFKNVGKKNEHY